MYSIVTPVAEMDDNPTAVLQLSQCYGANFIWVWEIWYMPMFYI